MTGTADDESDSGVDVPVPRRPARARAPETYAQQQARLDADAVARWAEKVTGMAPMTDEQISAVAEIFRRIDARRTTDPT